MAQSFLAADITKVDKKQHIVEGYATSRFADRDKQIVDENFLKRAYPEWARKYGNIRYMHKAEVVGHVLTCSDWDGTGFYITAKISDPKTWQQIEDGELNGFSIGIKNPTIIPDSEAENGRLIDGEVIETSVVDIPSSYQGDFVAIKSATFDTDSNSWEVNKTIDTNNPSAENMFDWMSGMMDGFGSNGDEADVAKRYYSAKERKDMSESDFAGPHRSFPIEDQSDLDNAAHLVGRAKDPEAVKRKIMEIAHRKGLKIPEAWQKDEAHKTLDTSSGLQPYNLEGDDKKEEKTTVADETNQGVVADQSKAAVEELHSMVSNLQDMMTTMKDALGTMTAMAAPQDPDRDGDVDNTNRPEEETGEDNKGGEPTHAATTDAPNAVEEMLNNAMGLKTIEISAQLKSDLEKFAQSYIDEKFNTVTKSTTADTDVVKGMVAGLQKTVGEVGEILPKIVERLEVVEQSAAPNKAVSHPAEKFATADKGNVSDDNLLSKAVSIVNEKYHGISPQLKQQYIQQEFAKLKGGNN